MGKDTIYRQDAINALHTEIVKRRISEDVNDDGSLDEFDTEDILRKLPLADVQPMVRWISCSDRLPNCNGIYIVTRIMSDGFECRNIVDACYFDGSDTWHDDTRVNHGRKYLTDVVAWRLLPEPYQERREE